MCWPSSAPRVLSHLQGSACEKSNCKHEFSEFRKVHSLESKSSFALPQGSALHALETPPGQCTKVSPWSQVFSSARRGPYHILRHMLHNFVVERLFRQGNVSWSTEDDLVFGWGGSCVFTALLLCEESIGKSRRRQCEGEFTRKMSRETDTKKNWALTDLKTEQSIQQHLCVD